MKGRIIRDITPSPENRRNSEGSFITLKDGSILFAYSRFGNQGDRDESASDIYGVLSYDNGESFGEPFPLFKRQDADATNIMSASLQRMANGDLGLFFLAKRDPLLCLPHLVRSKDEGKTWSKPVCCVQRDGYFILNNDRVIRLPNGRLLLTMASHETGMANGVLGYLDKPGYFEAYASDDDGYTWFALNEPFTLPIGRALHYGVQEPGAVVLKDSRIWSFIRNDSGRQYETFSSDNGVTWTPPVPSAFTAPPSPMTAKRLSDGRIMAVWNPIPLHPLNPEGVDYEGVGYFWNWGRTPLVYALSEDETETFGRCTKLETGDEHGYCYAAIYEVSDGVLLGYNAGGMEDSGMLNRLRIRKIPMSEL